MFFEENAIIYYEYQDDEGEQMKGFLKFTAIFFSIVAIIWMLLEILAIPALFFLVGLFNDFPWQYYVVTIGGYFIIAIIIQTICHFIFNHFEKRYESTLEKLFRKFFEKKDNQQE